ncbi:hypothetical protein PMG11_01669 [Penicillium brasilianum]|uniref:O-methyltransferase C-terminal domain-containing protein n=1 Tax=Penicillium brasilianum TaxID=104259 RepID=A0A0F7TK59_PENBI|nr:hypothetical protein PMG11_01669 [Penicillium brasilianum]
MTSFNSPAIVRSLAQNLEKDVETLTNYLDSVGQPAPSFDLHSPTVVLPGNAPSHAHEARERILDHCLRLFRLTAGPSEYLANLQTGYHYISCLRWLCHFKIFHLVPIQGSISYSDLAVLAKVPESALKSIARMAITDGLFIEKPEQHLAHSTTSALLQRNSAFHDWAIFNSDISAPTALAMVDVHEKWQGFLDTTHTAYNAAFDTDVSFFKHLGQQPERHRQFAGYMRAVTESQGTGLKQLVDGWDWAGLGNALVVDVGGSTGHASIALARRYPELTFIVEDLPEVVEGGPKYLASQDDRQALEGRVSYKAHSFFDPQPVQDADVYLLRMILHDWASADSVRILKHLAEALKPGSRIIIMDTVLPDPGSIPVSKERLLRVRDLTMMQVFNSQERHLEDWEDIISKVPRGLRMDQVIQPSGSVLSLIGLALK